MLLLLLLLWRLYHSLHLRLLLVRIIVHKRIVVLISWHLLQRRLHLLDRCIDVLVLLRSRRDLHTSKGVLQSLRGLSLGDIVEEGIIIRVRLQRLRSLRMLRNWLSGSSARELRLRFVVKSGKGVDRIFCIFWWSLWRVIQCPPLFHSQATATGGRNGCWISRSRFVA